jgi:hypothetical protein
MKNMNLMWFHQMWSVNVLISGPLLWENAAKIALRVKKYFSYKNVCGGSVSEDTVKQWKEFLPDLCQVMNLKVFLMLMKQDCFIMYFLSKP